MSSLENRTMARRGFVVSLGTWLVWLTLPASLFRRTGLRRPSRIPCGDRQKSAEIIVMCDPDAIPREAADRRTA
jgi:hypothetical protein